MHRRRSAPRLRPARLARRAVAGAALALATASPTLLAAGPPAAELLSTREEPAVKTPFTPPATVSAAAPGPTPPQATTLTRPDGSWDAASWVNPRMRVRAERRAERPRILRPAAPRRLSLSVPRPPTRRAASLAPDPASSATPITTPDPSPGLSGIPLEYLRQYRRAAADFGIDWAILAAIGSVETDHGRSTLPGVHAGLNAFGCCAGPMQFNLTNGPPSTWEAYATDGDRDGVLNPYSPSDAIASAARKLSNDGAPGDYRRALFRYNHDTAYVESVLARAARYRVAYGEDGGYAAPLGSADVRVIGVPGAGTHTLGNWQSDNAVDLAIPSGSPVYAVCDGVVGPGLGPTSGGVDPASRFGGLRLTLDCGPNRFWYGHLSSYASEIAGGVTVTRGQEVARSGVANGVAHLHIAAEFGDPRDLLGLGAVAPPPGSAAGTALSPSSHLPTR